MPDHWLSTLPEIAIRKTEIEASSELLSVGGPAFPQSAGQEFRSRDERADGGRGRQLEAPPPREVREQNATATLVSRVCSGQLLGRRPDERSVRSDTPCPCGTASWVPSSDPPGPFPLPAIRIARDRVPLRCEWRRSSTSYLTPTSMANFPERPFSVAATCLFAALAAGAGCNMDHASDPMDWTLSEGTTLRELARSEPVVFVVVDPSQCLRCSSVLAEWLDLGADVGSQRRAVARS